MMPDTARVSESEGEGVPDYIVEYSEGDVGPSRISSGCASDAAEAACEDWAADREVIYDGEECDVRVRPAEGGASQYFRCAATVKITWLAAGIDGPDDDDEPDD